jgi:murein DD-endopeptidase MepM/ murein hydrolase activator NlpD
VRKTSVIPAAVLAAGFLFCLPQVVGGETVHHSKSSQAGSKGGGSVRTEPRRKKTPTTPTKKKASKPQKKARHVIRQNSRGAVVAERVAVVRPESYGPFLPLEEYRFPQLPCVEWDAIIEAHEHEADEEAPEPTDVAEAMPPAPPVSALTLVARSIGSFLRPKSAQSTLRPEDVDLSDLLSAGVMIPVEGVDSSRLKDSFLNSRGKHRQHLAIDIGAPKGTPVLAAADGEVVQLRREKRGGISLYQKDATGRYLLFYCHLTKYAQGLRPGQRVAKGDVIAYVGRTGHVIGGPHLHFSITRLPEDDDNFKAGVAINPYLLFLAAVQ